MALTPKTTSVKRLSNTVRDVTRRSRVTSPLGWSGEQWLERYLVVSEAWAHVLGRYVDPVANFFRAGGTREQVGELLSALRVDAGIDLSRKDFEAVATQIGVLQLVAGTSVGDTVPFRTTGAKPPLFLVSGSGGVAPQFAFLARELGDGQPVIGLQSRAAQQRRLPEYSWRGQIRRLADRVESFAPSGQVALGGHSLGGLVALGVAHELTRRGRHVKELFIVDSRPEARFTRSLGTAVPPTANVLNFPRPVVLTAPAVALAGVVRPGAGKVYEAQFYFGQVRRLVIPPIPAFNGPTHLFVTAFDPDHVETGWRYRGGGPLTVDHVPGSHNSCLRPPHVKVIAQHVASYLSN